MTFAIKRIVSLSSIVAAVVLAVTQMIVLAPAPFSSQNWSLGLFCILAPLLVILRHRGNIARLIRGEEHAFSTAESNQNALTSEQDSQAT